MTNVISVRGRKPGDFTSNLKFVYVGREVQYTEWKASIWGNPFGVTSKRGLICDPYRVDPAWFREQTAKGITSPVDLYRLWLPTNKPLWDRLFVLEGKTLGCWCGFWNHGQPTLGCHAVVLAQFANALSETSE